MIQPGEITAYMVSGGKMFSLPYLFELAAKSLTRDKQLLELAGFIVDGCYKHGRGDDACNCEWVAEVIR